MGDLIKTQKDFVHMDKKANVDYWERQFATTYNIGEIDPDNRKILTSLVRNLPKGLMLDNGCGNGRIKKLFEDLGWEVYGSDLSRNAIIKATKIAPVNLVCTPSENLPFRDKLFDIQISWRVLHSIPKETREKVVREMGRVLKKHGLLFCSVQTSKDDKTIKKYKEFGIEIKNDPNTFVVDMIVEGKKVQRLKHFYSKEDIISELERNREFKVENVLLHEEKCGWSDKKQTYWIVKARKL